MRQLSRLGALGVAIAIGALSGCGLIRTVLPLPNPGYSPIPPLPYPGISPLPPMPQPGASPLPPLPYPGVSPGIPPGPPEVSPAPAPNGGLVIMGHITDNRGNRMANVVVDAQSASVSRVTVADPWGQYRLSGFNPGEPVQVTAMAMGYQPQISVFTPTGDWRVDFSYTTALVPQPVPPPSFLGGPALIPLIGHVQDNHGAPLDGVLIQAVSADSAIPFHAAAVSQGGTFQLTMLTNIPMHFKASLPGHLTVLFDAALPSPTTGVDPHLEFTGAQALAVKP
jgi:hypothetical protein